MGFCCSSDSYAMSSLLMHFPDTVLNLLMQLKTAPTIAVTAYVTHTLIII